MAALFNTVADGAVPDTGMLIDIVIVPVNCLGVVADDGIASLLPVKGLEVLFDCAKSCVLVLKKVVRCLLAEVLRNLVIPVAVVADVWTVDVSVFVACDTEPDESVDTIAVVVGCLDVA